jgi:hypothetical protein
MSNEPVTQSPSRGNKWLRMGRKILFSAILLWIIHFILDKTGWDTWEKFSAQADTFTEKIISVTVRLTPYRLWQSLTSDEGTIVRKYDGDNSGNSISSNTPFTYKKFTFKEKVLNWFGNYWYTDSGKTFWFGRILLILTALAALSIAYEDYQKSRNKTSAVLYFPVNVVIKFFLFLLGLSIFALIFYFIIKILLAIAGGIVAIFTGLASLGGFIKLLADEIKGEAAGAAKKSVGAYVFPFFYKSRKPK